MFKKKELEPIVRVEPKYNKGLTSEQVEDRKKRKLINVAKNKKSKSAFRIVFENVFTFFNLIWVLIFVALVSVGAFSDLLFMVIVFLNTMSF